NRNPLATVPLPIQPTPIFPGCPMIVPIPTPPASASLARYALLITDLSGSSGPPGGPGVGSDTTDFVLFPLDTALAPTIESIDVSAGDVTITWSSTPDRTYRLQSSSSVSGPTWTDLGDVLAVDTDTSLAVPVGAA